METTKYGKITDLIEAAQFTGGRENGEEIVKWVQENDRGARWMPAVEAIGERGGTFGLPEEPEKIQLRTPRGIKTVPVGDWIYKDEKGDFRSMSDEELDKGYTTV